MDALDRELAAALDVSPSPEFLACVRARIANEPPPASWRMPRLLLAAGTVAAVIGISVLVTQRPTNPDVASAVRRTGQPAPAAIVGLTASARAAASLAEPERRRKPDHRRPRGVGVIRLVSIDDLPTAPIDDVVPAMRVDTPLMTFDAVTMTGVHP